MGPQRDAISFYPVLDGTVDRHSPVSKPSSARYSMNISLDDDSQYEYGNWDLEDQSETDEGRLSRSLQTWMPDHVILPLNPREKPAREPVFSARLGKARNSEVKPLRGRKGQKKTVSRRCKTAPIKRVPSEESIVTRISLLSCSSGEQRPEEIVLRKSRRRRRKAVSPTSTDTLAPVVSKWVELASRKTNMLQKFSRTQTVGQTVLHVGREGEDLESEAFELLAPDEQRALFKTGVSRGIKYGANMKKSGSLSNIPQEVSSKPKPRRRTVSANSKKSRGKPLDLQEVRRQMMNRKLALEQAKLLEKQKKSKRGLLRHASRQSLTSLSSRAQSPPSASVLSSSDLKAMSTSDNGSDVESLPEQVWKGDREILEIDLKRDLTSKVKRKITTTTNALANATGLGEDNSFRTMVGVHDEFPKHTDEDFGHYPRITQRVRISPHLSHVIRDDIKVRMGRPRYHEITIRDLHLWNKGQDLNRAHRNLKVFNWLHSLKESEFRINTVPIIVDEPSQPGAKEEYISIHSVDEPPVKPLYKAYEVRIL